MPVNKTGRPIMHRALRQLIYPGQVYPGREVGSDGEYLPDEDPNEKKAPEAGAAGAPAKADPEDWPDRATLGAMELPALKAWATSKGVKFHPNAGEAKVLDAIDAARTAGAGSGTGGGEQ